MKFGFLSDHEMEYCLKIFQPELHSSAGYQEVVATKYHYTPEQVHEMEACCRANIQCDEQKRSEFDIILTDETRHCECEHKFRHCLKKSNHQTDLGVQYFKIIPQCYAVDHPMVKCNKFKCFYQPTKEYTQYPHDHMGDAARCVEYELDVSKAKVYQTFDLPFIYDSYGKKEFRHLEREAQQLDSYRNLEFDGTGPQAVAVIAGWTSGKWIPTTTISPHKYTYMETSYSHNNKSYDSNNITAKSTQQTSATNIDENQSIDTDRLNKIESKLEMLIRTLSKILPESGDLQKP